MTSAMPAHVCPRCQSASIDRDRRTFVDKLVGPLLRRRPGAPVLLGAHALEGLRLAADPVGRRLVPVPAFLLTS